ncbi:FecR family protein [Dyadobacter sp. CY323]|uniref:FecR family protein n=1 Tax=Dyadobacter sp. CY323 TaxID=2907302 RepID=UPI001F1D43D7|nr:FecR family protein [Dyadobacter sp. CY323]MCE6991024.1 FecR family protein [Dyadobacter sp. CY323]
MDRYNDFTVEDFVWDDFFRQWALAPTPETSTVWDEWVGSNPEMLEKVQQAKAIVLSLRLHEPEIADPEITRIVKQTIAKTDEPVYGFLPKTENTYRLLTYLVAASATLLMLAGWAIYTLNPKKGDPQSTNIGSPTDSNIAFIEKVNHSAEPMRVDMEDGSKITIAPAGRLRYPKKPNADKREVYLEGEAFFDIAKDPGHPFFVYSNGLITKVLGTSFSIEAYYDSNEVTVEVKTGRVAVFAESDPAVKEKISGTGLQGVVLRPNQKIIYSRDEVRMVKTLVEQPEMVVAKALTPQFEFEDTPASDVFDKVGKAYGIDILYDENLLKDCPLTATLDNQTLHEKLSIICKAVEASYEILDGQIVIYSKGCKN